MITELAVLVPVLNRPANVAPLVESFLANCPDGSNLYFLIARSDREELLEVDRVQALAPGYPDHSTVRSWVTDVASWPEKINWGVTHIDADWYLCAADDVEFTPGWWEATKELRENPQIGVIGTNDSATNSGNPRVAAGDHTCHPLIRGTYVHDHGTIDEPGKAVHDKYSHWYVDDELIYTAKSRNAWAFCKDAVIEHLHPYWGKGEWDTTYAKGEENAEADEALFISRAHLFGVQVG